MLRTIHISDLDGGFEIKICIINSLQFTDAVVLINDEPFKIRSD